VLLFEDIDCAKGGKAREDASIAVSTQAGKENAVSNGVTLSGLLNVLDGFYAPANVLFVMTTNHIELLDEALLRPGRIDYRLYLGKATKQQKVDLYCRFFPKASESEALAFVELSHSTETMAEFQGLLLGLEQKQKLCSDSLLPAMHGCAD
jgi:chaperone BCS1